MNGIRTRNTAVPKDVLSKWQNVVDIMAEILSVPSAIVTRVDPPMIEVLRAAQIPENPYKAGDKASMARHYCETVVCGNRKLQVSYAPKDPLWNEAPEIQDGICAYLGLPLCWPGGDMFSTICVLDNKENLFGIRYEKVLLEFKELIETHLELLDANERLKGAMAEVRILRGMLPICSFCKNIRDDSGYWIQIESYIRQHSEADFSHGICPECAKEHYPDFNIYED